MASIKSGFWQCALDRALLLYVLGVITLWVADRTQVADFDWGQTFTIAGILAFLYVAAAAVCKTFFHKEEAPKVVEKIAEAAETVVAAVEAKTGKGGGK